MEFKIVQKTENKILERDELEVRIQHEGEPVPTREQVLSKVAASLNKERNQVVLIKLQSKYGISNSIAWIHVYDTAERTKIVEKDYLLKRSGILKELKK